MEMTISSGRTGKNSHSNIPLDHFAIYQSLFSELSHPTFLASTPYSGFLHLSSYLPLSTYDSKLCQISVETHYCPSPSLVTCQNYCSSKTYTHPFGNLGNPASNSTFSPSSRLGVLTAVGVDATVFAALSTFLRALLMTLLVIWSSKARSAGSHVFAALLTRPRIASFSLSRLILIGRVLASISVPNGKSLPRWHTLRGLVVR